MKEKKMKKLTDEEIERQGIDSTHIKAAKDYRALFEHLSGGSLAVADAQELERIFVYCIERVSQEQMKQGK